jgi:hypothetical protein
VTYSGVELHPSLSAAAKDDDDPQRFEAHQQMAEQLLELDGAPFTRESDITRAKNAIALQISYQYALGMDAFVYSAVASERVAMRSFRGGQDGPPVVHRLAKMIADSLLASRDATGWGDGVRGIRGGTR